MFIGKIDMGKIKHWEAKTLGEVCEVFTGNSINQTEKEKNFTDINKKGLNYIATKDISFSNVICYENGVKIPQDKLEAFRIATADSTLLCIEGGSAGRKVAFLNQNVCFGNKLCCFKTKDYSILNSKFVYFYLQSSIFIAYFHSNKSGLIGGITKANLKKIKIPLPPLDTQKRIVELLDFKFAKIENATNALNFVKKDLVKLKASLLNSAFNGTLLEMSLRGSESSVAIHKSRIDKDNGLLRVSPRNDAFPSVIASNEVAKQSTNNTEFTLPHLPQDWEIKTLGEVLFKDKHSMKRGPFGSALKKEFFVNSGVRVFEQYNPINQDSEWKRYFISQEKFQELKDFKAGAGDLLISCSGTFGKILELPENVEEGIINQALLKIKLDNSQILNKYFIFLFNSPYMQNIISESTLGTAIKNMASVKDLKKIKIPLPPLKTQKQIVELLEAKFKSIEKLEHFTNDSLDKLSKLKASLLNKAFSGELVC